MKWFKFITDHWKSQLGSQDDGKSLPELLQEAADYYSPMLPRKSDEDTVLESVTVEGETLQLRNTLINDAKEDLEVSSEEFEEILKPILLREVKRYKRLGRILTKGGEIAYQYYDRNGSLFTVLRLSSADVS